MRWGRTPRPALPGLLDSAGGGARAQSELGKQVACSQGPHDREGGKQTKLNWKINATMLTEVDPDGGKPHDYLFLSLLFTINPLDSC